MPGPNSMMMMDFNRRLIYDCPHTDRRYYAKGMCLNCYHRSGRTKKAWNCAHKTRPHYSKGKCKVCYLDDYNKSRKVQSSDTNTATNGETGKGGVA